MQKKRMKQIWAILTEQACSVKHLLHSKTILPYYESKWLSYFKRRERKPTVFVAK